MNVSGAWNVGECMSLGDDVILHAGALLRKYEGHAIEGRGVQGMCFRDGP